MFFGWVLLGKVRQSAKLSLMTLEDHVGDVIRKARQAARVSTEAAARAAGLGADELAALEETGILSRRPNYAGLAGLIGLHAAKLEGIAGGWLPRVPDLSGWRELRTITTSGEGLAVNCYLVWDEATREAAVFDTGWEAQPIFDLMAAEQLQLKHLFITHTHRDHIAAIEPIRERYPKVRLHSNSRHAPPDQRNRPRDFIHLGSLRITNRETPGHAEDGVTYVIGGFPEDAPHVAVVGDCIFAGSMGRGNQSAELLKQKVLEQIFSLPPNTLICPGHGPVTTIEQEKAHNPFFLT